jgi:D-3-phosphoglycerate dehydrogenase
MVGRPRDDLKASLGTADGLIVRSETRVDRDLLAAGPKLTVVARAGVGVDSIDVAAATAAGVVVLNTPAANTISATEQTFGLMLSLARNIPQAVQSLREGRWDRLKLVGTELSGKTLGIVGLGRIGGNIATRARAFGMTVQAHDPYIATARADAFDAKLLDLETLLRTSDVVTLHVPLTGETRGMIDLAKLRMRRDRRRRFADRARRGFAGRCRHRRRGGRTAAARWPRCALAQTSEGRRHAALGRLDARSAGPHRQRTG